jgi:type IV secretory pathway VirB10-like protein
MHRDSYVSISEGARIVGASIDTLRRWDDDGVFKATIRTPGGQRRFLLAELVGVREGDEFSQAEAPTTPSPPAPESPRTRIVQPWEAREAEARADVTVTKARIERREEVRRYREAEVAREGRARAEAESRTAETRQRQALSAQLRRDQHELDHCLSLLRMGYGFERPAMKAEIEKFLAEQARPGVSLNWIEATVAAIRERHATEHRAQQKREAEERQEKEKKAQDERDAKWRREWKEYETAQRKNTLIAHGERIALTETSGLDWDDDIAVEARAAVKEELEAEVSGDWSERDVDELVQEVLAEWEPW